MTPADCLRLGPRRRSTRRWKALAGGGECGFVEKKFGFEVVRTCDADQISDLSAQPRRWLMMAKMEPSDLFDVAQRADAAAEALRRTPPRARTAAASARHA